MPLIFIHGVNTRDTDTDYAAVIAARDELFRRRILAPMAKTDPRFVDMAIVNPYWGAHGVTFAWGAASLPNLSTEEYLGSEDEGLDSDVLFTDSVRELSSRGAQIGGDIEVEALGPDDVPDESFVLRKAARADLIAFLEHVLTPVLLSQYRLMPEQESAETEGKVRALLAVACADVGTDPRVRALVASSSSDEEAVDLLANAVIERLGSLMSPLESGSASPADDSIEELGTLGLSDSVRDRARELFDRALGAPGRVATLPLLRFRRERLNRQLTRFLGDVFVYLNERGRIGSEGPIVAVVRKAIEMAPRVHDDEPLIVVTHSMGGNILYDLITHFWPTLTVDAWISVGGQVGQFEEMKLFHASDKTITAPKKVTGLEKRVKYWLNVYDPADALSFLVPPFSRMSMLTSHFTQERAHSRRTASISGAQASTISCAVALRK